MKTVQLPILNPEAVPTKRMRQWLQRRGTRRRLLLAEMFVEDPHCRYCRRPLKEIRNAVLDHAVPSSRGGGDGRANAVLSCRSCDKCKANMSILEWRAGLAAGLFSMELPDAMKVAQQAMASLVRK